MFFELVKIIKELEMNTLIGFNFLILNKRHPRVERDLYPLPVPVYSEQHIRFPKGLLDDTIFSTGHGVEWMYNTIVSGGKSYVLDTMGSASGDNSPDNMLVLHFSMEYDDTVDEKKCSTFCLLPGPDRKLWGKNMGMYIFLLRLTRPQFRKLLPTYGVPDQLMLAQAETRTCVNSSDMDMIEHFYSRCIFCCNENNPITCKNISRTWCIKCLENLEDFYLTLGGHDALHDLPQIRLLMIECLLSENVKWYSVARDYFEENDMLLCCVMDSKIVKLVVVVKRMWEEIVAFRSYKPEAMPILSPLSHYPRRPGDFECRVWAQFQEDMHGRIFEDRDVLSRMFFRERQMQRLLDPKKHLHTKRLFQRVELGIFCSLLSENKGGKRVLPSISVQQVEDESGMDIGHQLNSIVRLGSENWQLPEKREKLKAAEVSFQKKAAIYLKRFC